MSLESGIHVSGSGIHYSGSGIQWLGSGILDIGRQVIFCWSIGSFHLKGFIHLTLPATEFHFLECGMCLAVLLAAGPLSLYRDQRVCVPFCIDYEEHLIYKVAFHLSTLLPLLTNCYTGSVNEAGKLSIQIRLFQLEVCFTFVCRTLHFI